MCYLYPQYFWISSMEMVAFNGKIKNNDNNKNSKINWYHHENKDRVVKEMCLKQILFTVDNIFLYIKTS